MLALSVDSKADVVVSPLPAYGLYKHQTELLGGTFAPIPTALENRFVPTADELRDTFKRYSSVDPTTGKTTKQAALAVGTNCARPCSATTSSQHTACGRGREIGWAFLSTQYFYRSSRRWENRMSCTSRVNQCMRALVERLLLITTVSAVHCRCALGVCSCRIRSVALCFPNNPAGSMLTAAQARGLADVLDELLAAPASADNGGFSVIVLSESK